VAAARQFEEVLVREFVRNMTKDLFTGSLAGDGGAGWVKAQSSAQTDALTDAVTRHLVDSGTLGVSDMLIRKWSSEADQGQGEIDRVFDLKKKQAISIQQFMQLGSPSSEGIDHE
jgi:Rod binding domain-containing protein